METQPTNNQSRERIVNEIRLLTEELVTKIEDIPVEEGDVTPEGTAIKKERKAIIKESISDVKRICSLLDAIDGE